MKRKDIYRLAKISLASRKQTSKSTVRGIAFGMILLVPVLFIIVGLYGNLNSQVNSNPQALYASVNYVNSKTPTGNIGKYYNKTLPAASVDNIANKAVSDYKLDYEALNVPFDMAAMTTDESKMDDNGVVMAVYLGEITDDNAVLVGFGERVDSSISAQTSFTAVIDRTDLDNFVSPKLALNQSDVYIDGYDDGFKGTGKGEVIVSEQLLEVLGLDAKDVYGKKLSVSFNDMWYETNYHVDSFRNQYSLRLDTDNQPDNDDYQSVVNNKFANKVAWHFYDYTVAGIVKKDITKSAQINQPMSNMFFLSDASFDIGGGQTLGPELNIIKSDEQNYSQSIALATYTTETAEFEELNEEFALSGAFMFSSVMVSNDWDMETEQQYFSVYNQRTLFLDAGSYQQLDKAVSVITSELSSFFPDGQSEIAYYYASPMFYNMYMMYSVSNYMVLFLSIMGGIIFFAAMVNLFNSIVHSVDSRKHYLAVTRAIGGKDSLIPKLYIAESLTLFRRAFVWVIIFGGGICAGIKYGLDYLFKFINESGMLGAVKFGISFWYIPLALVLGLGLLLVLGFTFSVGISRKVSKDPIMSILGDS